MEHYAAQTYFEVTYSIQYKCSENEAQTQSRMQPTGSLERNKNLFVAQRQADLWGNSHVAGDGLTRQNRIQISESHVVCRSVFLWCRNMNY